MSAFQTPFPPATGYDPTGYFNNPGLNIPGPVPSINTATWAGSRDVLTWTRSSSSPYYTAQWKSPLFDLRPELRNSTSTDAQPGAVPIWRGGYGAGARLWVMLTGLDNVSGSNSATRSLVVRAQSYGHIIDMKSVTSINPEVDYTADVATGGDSDGSVLQFFPTGDGYPIRFWRIVLTFEKVEDLTPLDITIQGAYY